MYTSGLVLITICLANALVALAECCRCDCQTPWSPTLHHPELHYLLIKPSQNSLKYSGRQFYQPLEVAPVAKADTQYKVQNGGKTDESAFAGNKINDAPVVGYQNIQKQDLFNFGGQLHTDTPQSSTIGIIQQPQRSQVSTHQGTHYINIEQYISPQGSDKGTKDTSNLHDGKDQDHGKNDHYKFEYAVNNKKTHDIKRHKEEKNGDVVQGEYSLVEEDGNVRTVKYYADWKTGFHAQVQNSRKSFVG